MTLSAWIITMVLITGPHSRHNNRSCGLPRVSVYKYANVWRLSLTCSLRYANVVANDVYFLILLSLRRKEFLVNWWLNCLRLKIKGERERDLVELNIMWKKKFYFSSSELFLEPIRYQRQNCQLYISRYYLKNIRLIRKYTVQSTNDSIIYEEACILTVRINCSCAMLYVYICRVIAGMQKPGIYNNIFAELGLPAFFVKMNQQILK